MNFARVLYISQYTYPRIITIRLLRYMSLMESERIETESCWIMTNLPLDRHCIHSCVILKHVQRVPLLIDPHNVAQRWINASNQNKEMKPTFIHMAASDYQEQLASAIQLGAVAVLDITQVKLDVALMPILMKQSFNQGIEIIMSCTGRPTFLMSPSFKTIQVWPAGRILYSMYVRACRFSRIFS